MQFASYWIIFHTERMLVYQSAELSNDTMRKICIVLDGHLTVLPVLIFPIFLQFGCYWMDTS
jgi:hypothetical protein